MQRFVLVLAGLALLAPTFSMPAQAQYGGPPASQQQGYDPDVDVDFDPEGDGKEPYQEEIDVGYEGRDHSDEAPPPQPGGYEDQTWRGDDGTYYCRRSDGTTGTIIGGGAGALIGRGIDTRGSRGTGTILGALAGALIGRAIERGQRCR